MNSKCLESFLIPVMESGDKSLNSMNETQYNNFFVKLKSKAFKILKELCDKHNSNSDFVENKNNGYKLKIIHNSFRTSQVFASADANYNYYPFATLQYNYTKELFPKEAMDALNKEFKEYIDSDNMKIEYSNYVFYIYFKKYNKSTVIATESLATAIGGPALLVSLLYVIGVNIRDYKKNKEKKEWEKKEKLKRVENAKNKDPNKKSENELLIEKYNLNDPEALKKFKETMLKDTELQLKKMVRVLNKDKSLFDKIKQTYSEAWKDDIDVIQDELDELKPNTNYFVVKREGDYYWAICQNQMVASYSGVCWDLAEAMNSLHLKDNRYALMAFDAGDGDEGCVYADFYI